MIPKPPSGWFRAGLTWSARHTLGFGYLSIFDPDPADPLHAAVAHALDGGGADDPRRVLATLSGVIAGELIREGTRAGQLKSAAEKYEAETVLALTSGASRLSVAAAERKVRTHARYMEAVEGRRVSEARVVGLRAYANTVQREQEMLRTDRADARAANLGEAHDAT